jgi:hypothetical protein
VYIAFNVDSIFDTFFLLGLTGVDEDASVKYDEISSVNCEWCLSNEAICFLDGDGLNTIEDNALIILYIYVYILIMENANVVSNKNIFNNECKGVNTNNKKEKYYKLYLNDSTYLKNIEKYNKVLPPHNRFIKADTIVTINNCNDNYPTCTNTNTIANSKSALPKIILPSLNITSKHVKVVKIPNIYLQQKHTLNNIPLSHRTHSQNTYTRLEQEVMNTYMKKMENIRSFSMNKLLITNTNNNTTNRINNITNITSTSNSDDTIECVKLNDNVTYIKDTLTLNNSKRSQISQSSACVFGKERLKGETRLYNKQSVKGKKKVKEEVVNNVKNVFRDVNKRSVKVMKKKMLGRFYNELKCCNDIKEKLKCNIVNALECIKNKYDKELDMYQEGFSYRNNNDKDICDEDNYSDKDKNEDMLMNYNLSKRKSNTNKNGSSIHNIKLKSIHNNTNKISNIL